MLLGEVGGVDRSVGGVEGLAAVIDGGSGAFGGLPFAIAQAVMFFNDHNKLCAACATSRPDWVENTG